MTALADLATSQNSRNKPALQPGFVSADGRSELQLLQQTRQLACQLGFGKLLPQNDQQLQALLCYAENPEVSILRDAGLGSALAPHLQLLLVFLQLLKQPQQQFDQLPSRHLDFYYQQVLGFQAAEEQGDRAYVTVTLADDVNRCLLEKGRLFDAGERLYQLDQDTLITRTQLDKICLHKTGNNHLLTLFDRVQGIKFKPFMPCGKTEIELPTHFAQAHVVCSCFLFWAAGARAFMVNLGGGGLTAWTKGNTAVFISTDNGWQRLDDEVTINRGIHKTVQIALPSIYSAITVLPEQSVLTAPAIALVPLNNSWQVPDRVDKISVDVKGLKNIQIRNEQEVLDPSNRFLLFGPEPKTGTKFHFSHREIGGKALNSLTLKPVWVPGASPNTTQGLPDIAGIYKNYSNTACKKTETYKIKLGTEAGGVDSEIDLFTADGALEFKKENSGVLGAVTPGVFTQADLSDDPLQWPGCYQLAFSSGDFQYDQYINELNMQAALQAQKNIQSIIRSREDGDSSTASPQEKVISWIFSGVIHPPYTPELRSLTIDYTAGYTNQEHKEDTTLSRFDTNNSPELLPLCTTTIGPAETIELYLQLAINQSTRTISLLFAIDSEQTSCIDEYKARQEHEQQGVTIDWQYQDGQKPSTWQPLPIAQDDTAGLQQSGLLTFTTPPVNKTSDSDSVLIKAIINNPVALPAIKGIHTQVLSVTGQLPGGDSDPVSPLPKDSIVALVEGHPAIVSLQQPYPSFGGSTKESRTAMNTRVSERLRHRQRALTRKDYEQLALQNFPQIDVVKCLTCNEHDDIAPGEIHIIVVAKAKPSAPGELPAIPYVSVALRNKIKQFVSSLCSPNINITVKNPDFPQ